MRACAWAVAGVAGGTGSPEGLRDAPRTSDRMGGGEVSGAESRSTKREEEEAPPFREPREGAGVRGEATPRNSGAEVAAWSATAVPGP